MNSKHNKYNTKKIKNTKTTATHDIDEHHEEFKKWVKSLSIKELERALTFSFHDNNNCSTNFWIDSGETNSHEYDLLLEMINIQVPLPTPIHPR